MSEVISKGRDIHTHTHTHVYTYACMYIHTRYLHSLRTYAATHTFAPIRTYLTIIHRGEEESLETVEGFGEEARETRTQHWSY